jgi:hypothetical protein
LPAGRLAALGATPAFHHGLLGRPIAPPRAVQKAALRRISSDTGSRRRRLPREHTGEQEA